jgi:hypothetical protein
MSKTCACDCSWDDGDYPTFCREEMPTARRVYKCCECGKKIVPGQKYHKVVGVWDGDFRTFRTCLPCKSIRDDYCPGSAFGYLREDISNCLDFDYTKVPGDDGDD